MKLRKVIQVISFVLLVYLLLDIASELDIATTKNEHLITHRKAQIDKIDNIDSIKIEAKRNLDTIRSIHKVHSGDSKTQVLIITLLIIAQGYLIFAKPK